MIRKLPIALTACATVLLAASMVPSETASAEQLKDKGKKKAIGLLVPAIQKVREPAGRSAAKKHGPAKAGTRSGTR